MAKAAFDIYLACSDRHVHVAADTTALAALLAAGIPIEPGCQTGGCGSCMLAYVEGDVIHKDSCRPPRIVSTPSVPAWAATRIVLAL